MEAVRRKIMQKQTVKGINEAIYIYGYDIYLIAANFTEANSLKTIF